MITINVRGQKLLKDSDRSEAREPRAALLIQGTLVRKGDEAEPPRTLTLHRGRPCASRGHAEVDGHTEPRLRCSGASPLRPSPLCPV